MVTKRLCSIEGCGKKYYGKGWCHTHYMRWRRGGDPRASDRLGEGGHTLRYINKVVMTYTGDECLVWPYYRNKDGYGIVCAPGRTKIASRLVCEQVYGPPATKKHEAAHSCGNGHKGCVNPRHISWKTSMENAADKFRHGTVLYGPYPHFNAKLSEPQVREILSLRGTISQQKIADRFGTSKSNIKAIFSGVSWAWVK